MKKVFCIGELLIDFVGENQGSDLSKARLFTKKAGGAPANVACAISRLGGQSIFLGAVGTDPFGTFLLQVLKDNGVDSSLVQRPAEFTTLAFVSLAEEGERDFVFSRGADRELEYQSQVKRGFKDQMVHFGAATALLGGKLEDAYQRYFFDALTHHAFISFDPNFRADLWKGKEDDFVQKCRPFIEKSHLCKFSLEEALLLSGKEDPEAACTFLHALGAPLITVTQGSQGTLLSTPKIKQLIPSVPVQPVDTTGAGDAFMGCLLRQLAALENLKDFSSKDEMLFGMVELANKAGAITTTRFGAIEALPLAAELELG